MIDSITIRIGDEMNWHNPKLENVIHPDQHTWKGNIKNLSIRQTLDGVLVSGSLGKYKNGQNVQTIQRKDIQTVLEMIQNDTELNLEKSCLLSVEIGACMVMKYPVCHYLDCFGKMAGTRYGQYTYGVGFTETVGYRTKTGGLNFYLYDKMEESKGEILPEVYNGCNVLRAELRLGKRATIKRLFGGDISPMKLGEPLIYGELQNQFKRFYKRIPTT